jgi:hypothetical protein
MTSHAQIVLILFHLFTREQCAASGRRPVCDALRDSK